VYCVVAEMYSVGVVSRVREIVVFDVHLHDYGCCSSLKLFPERSQNIHLTLAELPVYRNG
jgi:hypothetical protein